MKWKKKINEIYLCAKVADAHLVCILNTFTANIFMTIELLQLLLRVNS